jgi:hypothetical protein
MDFGVREVRKFSGESACLYLPSSSEEAERMSGGGLDRAIARVQVWISRLLRPNIPQTDLTLASLFPHCLPKASFSP